MTTAAELAQALGGKKEGRQWRCACPVHGGNSLLIRDGKNGNPVVWCFGGCEANIVFAALRSLGLLNGHDPEYRPPEREPEPEPEEPAPIEKIQAIWRRARRIDGTLAAHYLAGRDLDPTLVDIDAVRFLPGTEKYPQPSLVSRLTSFTDDSEVRGLQFTRLTRQATRDGNRTFMTGSKAKGSVIRLVPDIDHGVLGIAEGIETALAVMTAHRRAHRLPPTMWAACGKGNLQTLPVLRGVERLVVYADPDGVDHARALAKRWANAGIKAGIYRRKHGDWNDLVH